MHTEPASDQQPTKSPDMRGARTPRPREELTFPGLLLGGTVLVAFFGLLTLALSAAAHATTAHGPTYAQWAARLPQHLPERAQWLLGDITEPQFYKSPVAASGLLLGAALAWWAGTRGCRWAGRPISYGSGLWPWVLGSASLSLLLSNLAFGQLLDQGWQPTFIPFVCVATALVLVHGRGWPVLLTGAVLGAVTTTPVAMLLIEQVTGPLDLPPVVANTAAMSIGTAASFLICRLLPWIRRPLPTASETPAHVARPGLLSDAVWIVRRVVTDFTETQFYANELASIGVLVGVVVAVLLNPLFPASGTGLIPQILFAQALTSTIGVLAWRKLYRDGGWAPTYISVVSVAPAAVIAYNGTAVSIVLGALSGALLCPAIARPISARLPSDFHPFIGNTVSMALSTAIIVPAIGLLPGQH